MHIGQTPASILMSASARPRRLLARFAEISAQSAEPLKDAFAQTYKFVTAAAKAKGIAVAWG